ncbi:PREDICTED: mitochondrial basic amino acids transporter-like isoform X1 [Poecilia mexicana]|uniref:Mitochondrial basic amino acids transporter n=1 Tax=Poecilia mexicana TaxID=48701 RepID=A0A3B3WVY3_9TELE|nr:PREDICTED: mitochondrial basic amino acids transporter-like isoform X1 [Poecilia mexicana]
MMDFVAGCIGGVVGVLVGHPFDTVKVRLQVQSVDKPLYRGTFHCFQSIIRQESVFGLYKGIGSPMMGLTFINAIVFGVQGNAMRMLGEDTPTHQFLAGAAAGILQSVICCPMELAKTRMQMQGTGQKKSSSKKLYKNSLDCLWHIYRREGLRGINRGMVTTLVREAPGFGVYFWSYAVLTQSLGCEPNDSYMIPKLLFSGGMAGIASWIVTYPADVIKSRLQADGVGGVNQYSGIADCVRQSVRKEGYMVFTRGLTSTVIRAFPVNAATFATVTLVLTYARGEEEGPECEPRHPDRHEYDSRL